MREELFCWEEIFYMFWYIDPYYFMLIVPAMLIALLAQARVSSTFNRYSRVYSHRSITAAQVARNILDENGLYDVQVQRVAGSLRPLRSPFQCGAAFRFGVYFHFHCCHRCCRS